MLAISEVRKREVYEVHEAIGEGYDARPNHPVWHTGDRGPRLDHEGSGCTEQKCCRQADHQDLNTNNDFYTTYKPQCEKSIKNVQGV
jgi:hypothetical protein